MTKLSKAQQNVVNTLRENTSAEICYTSHRVFLRWRDGNFHPTQTISRSTFHVLQAKNIIQKYGEGLSNNYKLSRTESL